MAKLTREQSLQGRIDSDHPEVEYIVVYHCEGCGEDVKFSSAAWYVWSKEQREMFVAEQERAHLAHEVV